jgi:molybdopterin converting factor small subunit
MSETSATIKVSVELFGVPRLKAGRRELELELPTDPGRQDLVEAIANECPVLLGSVLREDLSDLQDGYVFNHNGISFLSGDSPRLQTGDFLLLLSNQAGG